MWLTIVRGIIAGAIVVGVTEFSKRSPRAGAVLLTLPLVSILAFIMAWNKHRDLPAISTLAKETLILVPLGLPFFLPLAFAGKLGLDFWPAFALGVLLVTIMIGLWIWLGPQMG